MTLQHLFLNDTFSSVVKLKPTLELEANVCTDVA